MSEQEDQNAQLQRELITDKPEKIVVREQHDTPESLQHKDQDLSEQESQGTQ